MVDETTTQFLVGVITASVTFVVAVFTLIYNLLHERAENKRFQRQLEIEEHRSNFDKNRLAIELYNQREIRLFDARLENYPLLYEQLMYLASRDINALKPEQVIKLEKKLKEIAYTKVSSCISATSLEALTNLRNVLAQYAKGEALVSDVTEKRIALFQSMHRDLGRLDHSYLGPYEPQIIKDRNVHKSLQE